MKTLNILLVLIILVILNGCYNYKIKKFKVDPETGEPKLVSYDEYSHNVTPAIIEAHSKKKVMGNMAEQLKPHAKTDSVVYMSETNALAAMEIGGRYYLSTGYGEKRIDSQDGTVVGSVITESQSNPSSDNSSKIIKIEGYIKSGKVWHPEWDTKGYIILSEDEATFLSNNPNCGAAKTIQSEKSKYYK